MSKGVAPSNVCEQILHAACRLFVKQGFKKTTMRQIADEAHVGLGLICYYFESKENIAISFFVRMREKIRIYTKQFMDIDQDPYSYLAMLIYLEFTVNSSPSFFQLYYDCLENGVYEKYIMTTDTEILDRIMKIEKKTVPHDLLLLYSVFVCASVEKTLVINKENGLFPTIAYTDIPRFVFQSSAGTFSGDEEAMQRALATAKEFVQDTDSIHRQFTLEWILN